MSSFDKREEAFEMRYAHEEALRFKAQSWRNKQLGVWAAEKLGKSPQETEAYIQSLQFADLEEGGDEDVFRKIRADFDAAHVTQSDHQIRRMMDELMVQALAQVREKGE